MSGTVDDDEQLYRRIQERIGDQLCYRVENGRISFSQAAFNDPAKSPSVDRAILKYGADPHLSRKSVHDGIVSLQAAAIRRLGSTIQQFDSKGRPTAEKYDVDVTPDPKLGNCSHALVIMSPATFGSGTFKRLKEGLARLADEAGWTVEPQSKLPNRYSYQLRDLLSCLWHRLRGRV
jgi:hypothetical protein